MKIAKGLRYEAFKERNCNVHILHVDLTKRSIRPTIIGPSFPLDRRYYSEETRLPSLAKDQGALATVNGDFRNNRYEPCHLFVMDREIWTTAGGGGGCNLTISDGHAAIQRPRAFISVRHRPTNETFRIERVNFGRWGKVVAFTPRGGTNQFPNASSFTIRLSPAGDWNEEGNVQRRDMKVSEVGHGLMHVEGSIVLEFKWPRPKVFTVDDAVTWSQNFNSPGVQHVIGGATGLLEEGENIVHLLDIGPGHSNGPDNWYYQRNPRTAFGVSKDGKKVQLVAVEGRGVNDSPGLRLKELGNLMLDHGSWNATNTDGGGSTFMWIQGQMGVTKPNGLVLDSSYGDGTYYGTRPLTQGTAVF